MVNISCCGTDCRECKCYGNICKGCNECKGEVFHAPNGQACAIYECCVNQKGFINCGQCNSLPCEIWHKTRDPKFSDNEFEENIKNRIMVLNSSIADGENYDK